MKKEWLAILLLAVVCLGSALNQRFLRSFTMALDEQLAEAVAEAGRDNWESAEALAANAMESWSGMDKYTHILIRHGEIDGITDGFCTLLGTIRSRDPGSLHAAQLALRIRLAELYEMERLTPGSIF